MPAVGLLRPKVSPKLSARLFEANLGYMSMTEERDIPPGGFGAAHEQAFRGNREPLTRLESLADEICEHCEQHPGFDEGSILQIIQRHLATRAPSQEAIESAITAYVRSEADANFIDRRHLIGVSDAAKAILALTSRK